MANGGRIDAEPARRVARRAPAPAGSGGGIDAADPRSALAEAEAIAGRERSAAPWRRRPELAAAAWQRVEEASARALSDRRRALREARDRWPTSVEATAAALRRAAWEVREPGAGRREGAERLARATTALDLARRAAAAGRLEAALAQATAASAEADGIHRLWLAKHERFQDPRLLELWRVWAREAFAESSASGARQLLVDKLARTLTVYAGSRPVATFEVELGSNGLERKLHAGDRATPEGRYRIRELRGPGRTRFHRALLLDYPNEADRRRWAEAARAGLVPRGSGPGGLIEIHGMGGRGVDWTDGCVALTNEDMDRLFELASVGDRVTIVGSLEGFDGGS